MNKLYDSPLGKFSTYKEKYDARLLYPIPRKNHKFNGKFYGYDIWNSYELYWIKKNGCPQISALEIIYNCQSKYIIESKSLKLYLNALSALKFNSVIDITTLIKKDLEQKLETDVRITIRSIDDQQLYPSTIKGINIDKYYQKKIPPLYTYDKIVKEEQIYTNILKSNCPVTNQPDFGSLIIKYSGNQINYTNLIDYIISLKDLKEFHETCVEKIYINIMNTCSPKKLAVYARYSRRGGIDINPYRSSTDDEPNNTRLLRQ